MNNSQLSGFRRLFYYYYYYLNIIYDEQYYPVSKYWCHLQCGTASGPHLHRYFGKKSRSASSGVRKSSRSPCRFSRFPWSDFPQIFRVTHQGDERTSNVSKIEHFRLLSLMQPPKGKRHQHFGTEVVSFIIYDNYNEQQKYIYL